MDFTFIRHCKYFDLSIAQKDSKYGVVNSLGNIIIPIIYERIVEYNGYLWACEEYRENEIEKYEVFNYDGERVAQAPFGVIPSYCDGRQKSLRNGLHFVDISRTAITTGNYVDYSAVKFFAARNVKNIKMKVKLITVETTGEVVPVVHIEGINNETGKISTYDMWPRQQATKEDLKKIPETIKDLYFRIYFVSALGQNVQSEPEWLVLNPGDSDECRLTGKKRECGSVDVMLKKSAGECSKSHKHNILDKSFRKILPVDFDFEVTRNKFDYYSENLTISAQATLKTFGEKIPHTEYDKLRTEYDDWCVLGISCETHNYCSQGNILFNLRITEMKDLVYSEIVNIIPLMLCWRPQNSLTSKQFVSLTSEQRKCYTCEKSIVDIFIGSTLMWSVNCGGYSDLKYIGRDYFIAKSDDTQKYGIICSNGVVVPFIYDRGCVCTTLLDEAPNVFEELSAINSQHQSANTNHIEIPEYRKYKKIGESKYGYTPVCNADDKWGLINEKGEELYPLMYDSIVDIYPRGFAQVKLGDMQGLMDRNGQPLFEFGIKKRYGGGITPEDYMCTFEIEDNGKFGLMGPSFKILIPCLYDDLTNNLGNPLKNDCDSYYTYKIGGKEGVLSSTPYRIIVPPLYDHISIFENHHGVYTGETLFACRINAEGNKCIKEDIFNTSGELVYSVYDSEIRYIFEDVFVELKKLRDAEGWTWRKVYNIYSGSPKRLIASYDDCFLSNGKYLQVEIDGKWGIFDMEKGAEVIKCKYFFVGNDWTSKRKFIPKEDLIVLKINNKWGYIDMQENLIIPPIFDNANNFSEGLALVFTNGKCGYINKTGKFVIECIYDNANIFSLGLAPVEKDGGCGYIDHEGKVVIPLVYKSASPFDEDEAAHVSDHTGDGFINVSGDKLLWEKKESERYGSADDWTDAMNEVYENADGEWDNYWIDRC